MAQGQTTKPLSLTATIQENNLLATPIAVHITNRIRCFAPVLEGKLLPKGEIDWRCGLANTLIEYIADGFPLPNSIDRVISLVFEPECTEEIQMANRLLKFFNIPGFIRDRNRFVIDPVSVLALGQALILIYQNRDEDDRRAAVADAAYPLVTFFESIVCAIESAINNASGDIDSYKAEDWALYRAMTAQIASIVRDRIDN